METLDENIGEKIKKYRKDNNLSMPDFAELVNVPKDRLYKWEKGVTPYHTIEVENILEYINNGTIPNINSTSKSTPTGVPVYDVEFSAGFLEQIRDKKPKILTHINMTEVQGCDFVIRAKGDSMADYINNMDWIGIKKIEDIEVISYGQAYAIVTKDMQLIKYVRKGSKGTILLKSENKNFDDFELPIHKVLELYIVKTVLKIKTLI
jgi:phage repressor protein C with HTH and peptisase S24 domain